VLAYPLAGVLKLLPSTHLKHFFSLLVGLWFAQEIFGAEWVHSFFTAAVTYLLVLTLPRNLAPYVVRGVGGPGGRIGGIVPRGGWQGEDGPKGLTLLGFGGRCSPST
jgi:hypothetical protein